MSIILNPQGMPISQAEKAIPGKIQTTVDFSPESGLGTVIITLGDKRIRMSPQQAMELGTRLIAFAETAIMNAVAIQSMMEMGGLSLQEAVDTQVLMTRKVRMETLAAEVARVRAEEQYLKEQQAQAEGVPDGTVLN